MSRVSNHFTGETGREGGSLAGSVEEPVEPSKHTQMSVATLPEMIINRLPVPLPLLVSSRRWGELWLVTMTMGWKPTDDDMGCDGNDALRFCCNKQHDTLAKRQNQTGQEQHLGVGPFFLFILFYCFLFPLWAVLFRFYFYFFGRVLFLFTDVGFRRRTKLQKKEKKRGQPGEAARPDPTQSKEPGKKSKTRFRHRDKAGTSKNGKGEGQKKKVWPKVGQRLQSQPVKKVPSRETYKAEKRRKK